MAKRKMRAARPAMKNVVDPSPDLVPVRDIATKIGYSGKNNAYAAIAEFRVPVRSRGGYRWCVRRSDVGTVTRILEDRFKKNKAKGRRSGVRRTTKRRTTTPTTTTRPDGRICTSVYLSDDDRARLRALAAKQVGLPRDMSGVAAALIVNGLDAIGV